MSYTNRKVSSTVLIGSSWRETRTTGGVITPWDSGTTLAWLNVEAVKSGTSNPQWRKQVKSGNSAGTAYSVSGYRVLTAEPGIVSFKYSTGSGASKTVIEDKYAGYGYSTPFPQSYVSGFSKADNDALAQVYRKIDRQANQWKSLSFFAEFGGVVRQFGAPAQALVEYTHAHLERVERRLKGIKGVPMKYRKQKISKVLADSYLEYSFGLVPLISDTEKAAEALARFNYEGDPTNNPVLRAKAVGRGSEMVEKDMQFIPSLPWTSGKLYIDAIIKQSSEAKVQYVVGLSTAARANFGGLEHFRKVFGVVPEKLPGAIYEAVPWSWLIDYFTNVGDILSSVGVDTSSVKWIVKTTVMVDIYDGIYQVDVPRSKSQIAAYSYNFESITGSHFGKWKIRKTTFTRTIPSTLGWPSFQWSLPSDHLDKKLANSVAVLVQRRGAIPAIIAGLLGGAASLFS